ncbi:MAG: TIGR03936 family radical SAM-associated protein [Clostridiales Family XIII bacterium]|jgi:radical SAM-linked protein|nr:TIGR03936 family radical SAM-associated protein [Clostridiales Family XIII bacterium]
MKLLITFVKTGRMVYISHLDLARAFLRALRTAGLRPAYTQGYSPHPKMGFALPLSLGMHSLCEVLEVEVAVGGRLQAAPTGVLAALQAGLPEGVRVTGVFEKPAKYATSMASYVAAATYEIHCEGVAGAPEKMGAFFAEESVLVSKKRKPVLLDSRDKPENDNGMKEKDDVRDIRALMLSWRVVKDLRGRMLVEVTLAAGAGKLLNPQVFFDAFCAHAGLNAAALTPVFTRTAILDAEGGALPNG